MSRSPSARRRPLALLLTLLTALVGPAPLAARQQQPRAAPTAIDTPVFSKSGYKDNVFVIHRGEDGETTCRAATTEEKVSVSNARPGDDLSAETRVIYAGGGSGYVNEDGEEVNGPSTTETGSALLPSIGLRIVLHGTQRLEDNPTARNAFIVAANRWESLISTPITVVLDVDFGPNFFGSNNPFEEGVLGATGSSSQSAPLGTVRNQLLNNAPEADEAQLYNALPSSGPVPVELNGSTTTAPTVRMTLPVARALGLRPDIANPDAIPLMQGDAGIAFNSNFNLEFDFDPTNGITPGQLDFDAVVVHEIGHALGFASEAGNGVASPIGILDLFRFRPGAASLATFGTAPRVMSEGTSATDPQVFFSNRTNSFGTRELQLSTGGDDNEGGDQEQSSHWKDNRFTSYIGIMDPRLGGGRQVITSNDLSAFDVFGYKIGGVAPPPPSPPAAPANDNFSAAAGLNGSSGSVGGTNIGATREANEPNPANVSGTPSVWFRWTATGSGTATFDTLGSDYDTTLGVYTGSTVGGQALACGADCHNDDIRSGVIQSRVQFNAVAGTTYNIQVNGWRGEIGTYVLNWSGPGAPGPPASITVGGFIRDAQSNVIPGVGFSVTGVAGPQQANADGSYAVSIAPSAAAPVTITPSKYGYTFSPASATFSSATGGNQTAHFTGTLNNPIDRSADFVAQHYQDFLGRQPDQAGLDFWRGGVEQCGPSVSCAEVRRVDTSAAFFFAIEFQETGLLVYRMWKAAYANAGNTPVPVRYREFTEDSRLVSQNVQVGVGNWQQQLETNKAAYANTFASRQVFIGKYGAMSNADYVNTLNANAEFALSETERVNLVNALNSNSMTRAQVLRAVAEDDTLRQSQLRKAFVLMQYFGYLRRDPDAPDFRGLPDPDFLGYNFWLGKLNQFNGSYIDAEMVKAFITSIEYRRRFGQ